MDRRTFLKISGLMGLCVLGPPISFAGSQPARPKLFFDPELCLGCLACITACKRPEEPREIDRLYLTPKEKGSYPGVTLKFQLKYCPQCEKAPCVSACPHQALKKTQEGIIRLDKARCRGEGKCASVCPYQAIDVAFGKAFKCDLCLEELEKDWLPRCVSVCPTGALRLEFPGRSFSPETTSKRCGRAPGPYGMSGL